MYTINQILYRLDLFASGHQQINSFGSGSIEDYATSGTTNYPSMWVDYEPSTVSVNENSGYVLTQFKFYLLDRLQKGQGNLNEVFSDMQQVAIDLIAFCQSPTYFPMSGSILQFGEIQLEPKKDAFQDDEVAGWSFVLIFKASYDSNRCQIPSDNTNINL